MQNTASEKISILRPILIFLIVSTHIQGNLYRPDLKNIAYTAENFIHAFLSGALSASALPLLSIISGYLAAYTYKKYSYLKTVQKKIPRILVPMLVWNLIMALYIYNLQSQELPFRADLDLYPFNVENWLYGLLGLFRLPANPPLYFLRELFLCFLLIPVFLTIAKSKIATTIAVGMVAYMSLTGINLGLLHRVDIFGFFLVGLFLNNHPAVGVLYQRLSNPITQFLYLLGFIIALLLLTRYAFKPEHPNFIYYLKAITLIGPLAFWIISQYIQGALKRFFLWISPASFPVFLGHILFLNLYWNQWISYFKTSPISENYWLFWVSSFVFCYLIMGAAGFLYQKGLTLIKTRVRPAQRTAS